MSQQIPSNKTPEDYDIPLDWLYRGKSSKLKKAKGSSSVIKTNAVSSNNNNNNNINNNTNNSNSNNNNTTTANLSININNTSNGMKNRARSVSVSNAALQSKSSYNDSSSSASQNISMTAVMKKGRSSSSTMKNKPVISLPPSNSQIKRTPSMSGNNALSNTPSVPTFSSTKKSLFGSLFGKISSSKTTSTPTSNVSNIITSTTSTTNKSTSNNFEKTPLDKKSVVHIQQTPVNEVASPSIQSPLPPSSSVSHLSSSSSSSSSTFETNTIPTKTDSSISSIESLPDLSNIKLKRVTFSVDKFDGDPPQQLPTRKPKQGNILIPHDLLSEVPSISMGISSTIKDNTYSSTTANNSSIITKNSKEYKIAMENYKKMLQETEIHQQEAHAAALRIAREVANFSNSGSQAITNNLPIEKNVDDKYLSANNQENVKPMNFEIDKPIHINEHPFQESEDIIDSEKDLTLDVIYTRCCHLREILPIPSTLRQVKGKTAPLEVLKFLNPKPTLIDILSFCDFISIVPINTIIFDNVNLSNEMFSILIKSIVKSQVLEKLSLKNVLITKENWSILCKFLLSNKSLIKLDLSQTHLKFKLTDHITNQIDKDDNDLNCLRHNLDWDLFAKVITVRQGKPLEELLLNGVKFNNIPLEQFNNLLNSITKQTCLHSWKNTKVVKCRLGLASSDMSSDCLKSVLTWASSKNENSHKNIIVQGVDFSFNDLSQYAKSMVTRLSCLPFENLEFFSLNNTNISKAYDMALILKYLSQLPNLKVLDLSNLPHLFPDVLPYIYKYLPRFPNLRVLNIDNNNLTYKQMGVICNILIKCKSLSNLSLMQPTVHFKGQDVFVEPVNYNTTTKTEETNNDLIKPKFEMNGLWASLYRLVRDSPNLISLDVNFEEAPEEIESRIALCLMRNMNKKMDSDFQLDELTVQDDLLFDGELITGGAEVIFKKLNKLISEGEGTSELSEKSGKTGVNAKKYLLKKYFENLYNVHENVIQKIDCLFDKRSSGELTMKEKENLLRFVMLEKNLAHIFQIFDHSPHLAAIIESLKVKHYVQRRHCAGSTGMYSTVDNEIDATSPTIDTVPETRPHLMATDSGRTIDCLTGKPVLFRRSSNTSVQGKVQQEEEGELHKWGFFVQQRNMIYPEGTITNIESDSNNVSESIKQGDETARTNMLTPSCIPLETRKRLITKVPSGDELRAAIMKAKGIDSIQDLIRNVSDEPLALESIYGDCVKVNETYDKLLNNLSATRPTK